MKVLTVLLVFLVKNVISYSYNLSDFYDLPKIYQMENYANCMSENNLYCELEFEIKAAKKSSKFWKIIQDYDAKESFYDRKILFRAMCLSKLYKNEEIKLQEIGLAGMKYELEAYDLDADLINFHCKLSFAYTLRDYIIICVFCVYIIWIVIATSVTKKSTNKYLQYFSIIYNYKMLTKNPRNPHYNRLKFIQGVRLYCILFLVVGHSVLTHVSMYIENPEFFEVVYSYKVAALFIYFLSLLVPTFFILSGWLSVLKIDFSKFSKQDVLLLLVNRLLRYAPILLLTYTFNSNIFFTNDVPCTKMVDRFLFNCRIGWSYILIQNWFYPSETCNPHFWSLSVDIQAFAILLAAFYIIIKYKLPILRCLLTLCLFFILIQSVVIYYNNINAFFKITARNTLPLTRKSVEANLNYMSTIANLPGYLIGSIFGILYFLLLFFVSVIYLVDTPKSRLGRSIFGSLLKPIYATGLAAFLFGLAQNALDKLRKIFEMRVVEILGNCTLSIYAIHIPICFMHGFGTDTQTKIVFYDLVVVIIGDVIKSFLAGFVLYLTLEQPFAMLVRHDYIKEKNNKKE